MLSVKFVGGPLTTTDVQPWEVEATNSVTHQPWKHFWRESKAKYNLHLKLKPKHRWTQSKCSDAKYALILLQKKTCNRNLQLTLIIFFLLIWYGTVPVNEQASLIPSWGTDFLLFLYFHCTNAWRLLLGWGQTVFISAKSQGFWNWWKRKLALLMQARIFPLTQWVLLADICFQTAIRL